MYITKSLDFEPNLLSVDKSFQNLLVGDRKNLHWLSIDKENKFNNQGSKNILKKIRDSVSKHPDAESRIQNFNFAPLYIEWSPFQSLN